MLIAAVPVVTPSAMLTVAVPVVTVLAILTVSELLLPAAPMLIGVPVHPEDCPKLGQEVVGLKGSTHVSELVVEALSIWPTAGATFGRVT